MASAACEGEGDGVDHISDLSDDLLLHILSFLDDDARDVFCTSVLSSRWRNLWKRAPVLHLGNWNRNGQNAKDNNAQFNDFVHNVLARRAYGCGGADPNIDTLVLRSRLWPGKSRVDVWFRRAMHQTVTCLVFEVQVPRPRRRRMRRALSMSGRLADKQRPRLTLPASTRVTTLELELNYAVLVLPPTVNFHMLMELILSTIWFSDDDGPSLGQLLSSPSCCPRLRKLTLSHLHGLHDLRLNGRALETLRLESLSVSRLDVDAPWLSTLDIESYFMFYCDREHTSITVQAPTLKKLKSSLTLGFIQLELQRHTIQLLQDCRPIEGHVLCLYVPEKLTRREEDEAMTEIPQLPAVRDLTIKFCSHNSHYMGATVSSLLARCSNLEYLHLDNLIHLYGSRCENMCGDCDFRGSWKDDVISLEHLRVVKLAGFSGQEYCCLDLLQLLLASAPRLERMIVTAKASREGWQRPLLALKESLESSLPCGKGKWAARRATNEAATMSEYEWTPDFEGCSPWPEQEIDATKHCVSEKCE